MEIEIGKVEDFFAKVGVIALKLQNELKVGETIHVTGHTTDFTETVNSIQIEHKQVEKALPGDSIGIKINGKARKGDTVYKVVP